MDGGQEGDEEGMDEEEDRVGEPTYEVECLVGVKWAKHPDGVEKGKKPEHLFKARWKGYAAEYDTWEPLTNLEGEEISENPFFSHHLMQPYDA